MYRGLNNYFIKLHTSYFNTLQNKYDINILFTVLYKIFKKSSYILSKLFLIYLFSKCRLYQFILKLDDTVLIHKNNFFKLKKFKYLLSDFFFLRNKYYFKKVLFLLNNIFLYLLYIHVWVTRIYFCNFRRTFLTLNSSTKKYKFISLY